MYFERPTGTKHRAPRPAVFGLPELHPEVAKAKLVGNPGCYPTGATLAVAPLAHAGLVDRVVYDSKSGISGAGAEPTDTSHYPNMAQNVIPYKLTTHRHVPEIQAGADAPIARHQGKLHAACGPCCPGNPHYRSRLGPRGCNRNLADKSKVEEIYREFYKKAPFIRMADGVPKLSSVRGSNFCDISFEADKGSDRLVVISAIDNLVKGASGQAIQNMNLMAGIDERTGLWTPGLAP